jgi:1,4-alpha-glucan branching enzyme
MPASQGHITHDSPMGANLGPGGATFRVFAPSARAVYINGIFDWTDAFSKDTDDALLLVEENNYWAGFMPNVKDGDQYLFFVGTPSIHHRPCSASARTLANATDLISISGVA